MKELRFEWDAAKNRANLAKHEIDFQEAVRQADQLIRLISARRANRHEARQYRDQHTRR